MKNRVVVTGMGAVSPFGVGVKALWENLLIGKSKVAILDLGLDENLYTPYGAKVDDFSFDKYFTDASVYSEYVDRAVEFVLVAAKEACEQANYFQDVKQNKIDLSRVGVYIGTTTAGHISSYKQALAHFKGESFSSRNLFRSTPGCWPELVAHYLRANGASKSFCISCSAGGESIGNAYRDIRDGFSDIIIAGGGDAPISKINYLSFYLIKATSHWNGAPSEACQPYSLNRPGMVFGEGAGILVLESYKHAKARGAHIYGEIMGYAANSDSYHIVAPEPSASRYGDVITSLLLSSKIDPSKIGFISCHGTGTKKNDYAETKAIKNAFGSLAYNLKINSIKSMLGHAFGGSTAIEVIATIKTLLEGKIPPTVNHLEFDPECDLDCVPNVYANTNTEYAIKIATGFGGSNNAILIRKILE